MSVVANVAINVDGKQSLAVLDQISRKVNELNNSFGETPKAAQKVQGIGSALTAIAAKLAIATTAAEVFRKSVATAFERGAAEQRLQNITSSTQEYNAALALASQTANRFGLTQTESTKALGDVYGRLKGVGFGLKETGEIYSGFNLIAKQSGLVGEQAASAFFQLSQALGKGKLNGDEFVTISEQMPQLLDAIAATTGRSRGELAAMAQQGELTSRVLYEALSRAATASGDLNAKLTDQQRVTNNLKQASDNLLNAIGQLFAPLVIQGAKILTSAFEGLYKQMPNIATAIRALLAPLTAIAQVIVPAIGAAFNFVLNNIKAIVQIAGFFGGFVAVLKIVEGATLAWATAQKVAAVAAAALQAILNPATLAKTALAIAGATAASYALGKAMDQAAKDTKGMKFETKDIAGDVDKLLKNFSALPPVVQNAKDAAKELKDAQQQVTAAIQQSSNAYEQILNTQNALLDGELRLAEARTRAELAINDLQLQQAKSGLANAKNYQDQLNFAEAILNLEIEKAKIVYNQTVFQIKSEVQRARIAYNILSTKAKELEVVVSLARAQGTLVDAHIDALNAARDAVQLASINLDYSVQIGDENMRAAEAIYDASVSAARLAYEQNIVAKNTRQAADSQNEFAKAAQRASDAWVVLSSVTDPNQPGYHARRGKEEIFTYDPNVVKIGRAFATGGYVSGPTVAMVGEGGQGEYIVPENKASAFAMNYLSGARGAGAIPAFANGGYAGPINITTGPVLQQDGNRYVTLSDLEQALGMMADTLLGNNRSAGGRRFQGI